MKGRIYHVCVQTLQIRRLGLRPKKQRMGETLAFLSLLEGLYPHLFVPKDPILPYLQLHSQGQLGQHSQLVLETIRVEQHLESVFNLEQENKLGKRRAEQTESRAELHPKKPLIDYQWQLCPAEGCDLRTKYLKDHVYKTHIQSLFHQLTLEDRRIANIHRQRLFGLLQLAALTLDDGGMPHDLVTAVNESIRRIISGRPRIWGQLQGDMAALCEFAGWEVWEQFEVYPELNSPASLLYWRVLLFLLDQFDAEDRREFCCAYNSSGAWRRQEPSGNQTQDTPSGNPTQDTREEAPEPVSHQDTAQICMESSRVRSAVVTSKLEMSETEMVKRTDLLDVELQQVLVTCSRDASRQITLTTEPRRDPQQTVSPSPPQLSSTPSGVR